MAKPKLLLLDEASMGLAPLIVKQMFDILHQINEDGVTILLVEQNASKALARADHGYVLETGAVALDGAGSDLLVDERVRALHLGGEVAS